MATVVTLSCPSSSVVALPSMKTLSFSRYAAAGRGGREHSLSRKMFGAQ
jgi:hypothetical protein